MRKRAPKRQRAAFVADRMYAPTGGKPGREFFVRDREPPSQETEKLDPWPSRESSWAYIRCAAKNHAERGRQEPAHALGDMDPAVVDLREVKAEVRRLYPPGHAFREAILREQDTLPRDEVTMGKMATYLRLLYAVRGS